MKTLIATVLVTMLMPFNCEAGWLFGTNNRTIIHNCGAAPADAYYSAPDAVYSVPVMIYGDPAISGTAVKGRYKTKTHVHRSGRVRHHTHTKEIVQ